MTDEQAESLWRYLKKKLDVLDDNNYTARLIFDRVARDWKTCG